MGSLVSAADIIPTVTTGVGLYQDIRQQEQENAYQQARYQQQQQQADLAYQQALQQREWELQRRALEEQYRQQELAQQQARQQQEYQFALQQQQWELEQRAYEERLRDWELNRLALEQQNSYDALVAQHRLERVGRERRARVVDDRRSLQRGNLRLAVVQRQEARGPLRRRGTDCRVRRHRNISASGDGERQWAFHSAHCARRRESGYRAMRGVNERCEGGCRRKVESPGLERCEWEV
mgnify:CR=1 FL=1